ncbi:MAG: class I SAM-dependent methyltransferase [Bacteroidia bacterium]|nr:class I SAM-dependent methyltransferase [Bacteroidia bacterium]
MSLLTVFYVNHKEKKQCGVYQFGYHIGNALQKSKKYKFIYLECDSVTELRQFINQHSPSLIIYNYHPWTMPWVTPEFTSSINIPQIGTIHEVTQTVADEMQVGHFDAYIAPDPTLILKNPIVYKTGRLVPKYINKKTFNSSDIVTIGSFGFGLQGKGFDKVINRVQDEFDEAIIRLHIPYSDFADPTGKGAQEIANYCKKLLRKPNITIEITHNFLTTQELLDFLASNTLNMFCYEEYKNRGISSVIDFALAVNRPIALTKSLMFRHLGGCKPSIFIEDNSLKNIIQNGTDPIKKYVIDFSEENLIWEYEHIVSDNIHRTSVIYKASLFERIIRRIKREIGLIPKYQKRQITVKQWLHNSNADIEFFPNIQYIEYCPVQNINSFNTILNNKKREQYEATIKLISELNPSVIKRKIPEANIQQAFVFDTVYRFLEKFNKPRILCVGSFEDTASLSLKKIGVDLDEIDPVINYTLEKFIERPNRRFDKYDIIFSTSVIEHVEDDVKFISDMSELLAENGFIILTCDFKEDYKPGDPKPDVNYRFYTKNDLLYRLLPAAKDCIIFGEYQWDCPNPDFFMAGYNYTFATVVLQKTKN